MLVSSPLSASLTEQLLHHAFPSPQPSSDLFEIKIGNDIRQLATYYPGGDLSKKRQLREAWAYILLYDIGSLSTWNILWTVQPHQEVHRTMLIGCETGQERKLTKELGSALAEDRGWLFQELLTPSILTPSMVRNVLSDLFEVSDRSHPCPTPSLPRSQWRPTFTKLLQLLAPCISVRRKRVVGPSNGKQPQAVHLAPLATVTGLSDPPQSRTQISYPGRVVSPAAPMTDAMVRSDRS
jgi:hypothetical protein